MNRIKRNELLLFGKGSFLWREFYENKLYFISIFKRGKYDQLSTINEKTAIKLILYLEKQWLSTASV